MMSRFHFVWLACLLFASAHAQTVLRIPLHTTVQPASAEFLERGLALAAAQHDAAVLVDLGTPGGMLTSTRDMVSAIERSPVPVIVYVEPTGARAASAGFFLLESADVAAMAPCTNTGAAHPIVEGRTMDPVLKLKLEQDALALLRTETVPRHRDTAAATDAVVKAVAYTADEALAAHLIDTIQPNEATLLAALDGQTISRFDGSHTTLHLRSARLSTLAPTLRERVLAPLASANAAILLLLFGALLIAVEFHTPGTVVPGAVGTLAVLLALFALHLLPLSHLGLALVLAGILLVAADIKFAGHGVLATAGTAALILGLLTLVDAPPGMGVRPAVAVGVGIGFGAIGFLLATLATRARRAKRLTGAAAMLGLTGPLLSVPGSPGALNVFVRGELWRAEPADARTALHAGMEVRVTAIHGLLLAVEPLG